VVFCSLIQKLCLLTGIIFISCSKKVEKGSKWSIEIPNPDGTITVFPIGQENQMELLANNVLEKLMSANIGDGLLFQLRSREKSNQMFRESFLLKKQNEQYMILTPSSELIGVAISVSNFK